MSSAKIKPVRPYNGFYKKVLSTDLNSPVEEDTDLCIEIGCGAGLHPIHWSAQNPHRKMIAIERTKTKFLAFQRRLANHDTSNILAINADAERWLPQNVSPQKVSEYFFLYPNPYPKERQANKRWHRSPFFHFVLDTLKPQGRVHFATNELFMFEEALLYAEHFWKLEVLRTRSSLNCYWPPRTHFEKKYMARNQPCYDVTFRKMPLP